MPMLIFCILFYFWIDVIKSPPKLVNFTFYLNIKDIEFEMEPNGGAELVSNLQTPSRPLGVWNISYIPLHGFSLIN